MSSPTQPSTRESLMRTAEVLLRSKGYSAFSYADLAEAVGIRKASIHHHFPAKEDLGLAVVQAYVEQMVQAYDDICRRQQSVGERLEAFASWFMAGVKEGRLPLCGALAAEMSVLPERLQQLTRHFFRIQLQWLKRVLDKGVADGQIPADISTEASSRQILSLLEGASFIDWALDDHKAVDARVLLRMVGVFGEECTRH
ncbi:hypothetical protein AFAE65S_01332 [Alcaligenes phenolicus]